MELIPMPRVAELRQLRGKTQRELALEVGVTEATLRNWERNRTGVEWLERVAKLCQALDCQPSDLIEYVPIDKDGEE